MVSVVYRRSNAEYGRRLGDSEGSASLLRNNMARFGKRSGFTDALANTTAAKPTTSVHGHGVHPTGIDRMYAKPTFETCASPRPGGVNGPSNLGSSAAWSEYPLTTTLSLV